MMSAWTVARASCQGTKNRARQQPCQDHSAVALMPNLKGAADTLVVAIADGMGSAPRGGHGARMACRRAVDRMVRILWSTGRTGAQNMETLVNAGALQARLDLERLAARQERPLHTYATTLLLLVHTGGRIATLQIGDGAAVAGTARGRVTLAKPQRGEYANETNSLTNRGAMQRAGVTVSEADEPITELALMTDGVMELSLDSEERNPHDPFFRPLFEWMQSGEWEGHPSQELRGWMMSDAVRTRTADDTTMVLATRRPEWTSTPVH